jgi:hypothetical protein
MQTRLGGAGHEPNLAKELKTTIRSAEHLKSVGQARRSHIKWRGRSDATL